MPPHLNLNILKRTQTPPTNPPPSPQRPLKTPSPRTAASPTPTTSPFSPSSSALSTPTRARPGPRIPNTDPLPLDAAALAGLLNACRSQLQKLADRAECMNEWLEMDGIVLARLIQDIGAQVEKEDEARRASVEAKERAMALSKENAPPSPPSANVLPPPASRGPVSPGGYRVNVGGGGSSGSGDGHRRLPSGESRVPEVFLKGFATPPPTSLHGSVKQRSKAEERVDEYRINAGGGGSSSGTSGDGHRRLPSGESTVAEVFLKGFTTPPKSLHGSGGKKRSKAEERVDEHCGVRELRERIKAMRRWRRELERTVCWRREELARVWKAMNVDGGEDRGRESGGGAKRRVVQFQDEDDEEEGEDVAEGKGKGKGKGVEGAEVVKETGVRQCEGWGVGGKTWERKSGRVPSQSQWEHLFSESRIGWDDQGVWRRFLGC